MFHLVYLRSGPVLVMRGEYDWRSLANRFGDDFMTSIGGWDLDGLTAFLMDDWDDGLAAVDRLRRFAVGSGELADLTRDEPVGPRSSGLLASPDRRMAGPFVIGAPLLGADVPGGGFGLLFEAVDSEGLGRVAKVARAVHVPGEVTQVWADAAHGAHPVRVPAEAFIQNTGASDWSRCTLGHAALRAVLRSEADILARDLGALLPISFGVWESDESGEPVLVMERLEGRAPCSTAEVRDLLSEVADAVDRGTFDAHGDLKPEHVFIDPNGAIRVCDPAPRFLDHGMRGYTPAYNPRGLRGAASDVAACASMIRFLEGDFTPARGWVGQVLDAKVSPQWISNHRAALAELDIAVGTTR